MEVNKRVIWSILMPSVPARMKQGLALVAKITAQIPAHSGIEVLYLCDNKQRTTGAKRNALFAMAQGEYFCFVDDDDDVKDYYIGRILPALDPQNKAGWQPPDVVTFPVECWVNGQFGMTETDVLNVDEDWRPEVGVKRKPGLVHVWRRGLFGGLWFGDKMFDEHDQFYVPALARVKTVAKIDMPVYIYRTSRESSEAFGKSRVEDAGANG
jgi:glycosyltransferase involved in cell wall biosynthesis